LVVDDDQVARRALARLLQVTGFDVAIATNGREALDMVVTEQPDIILLDVMMPGPSGFDICRALKHDPGTRLIPVVLLTGLESTDDRVKGIEAGADEFLSKPFEQVELMARVRALLRTKRFTDELEQAEAVLFALAKAVERRDVVTENHCERIAEYGVALGAQLGLGDDQLKALRRAGFLHDIGKVGIPDAILLKPGPLSRDEQVVMQEHPVIGERICQDLRTLRAVLPIIRHHHERFDGSGYPDGLVGDEIPLAARVIQVVDVFDALTDERPYKSAMGLTDAVEHLRGEVAKGWRDPVVFAAFEDMAREMFFEAHASGS